MIFIAHILDGVKSRIIDFIIGIIHSVEKMITDHRFMLFSILPFNRSQIRPLIDRTLVCKTGSIWGKTLGFKHFNYMK